jgi:hypothetical protein
VKEEDQRTLKMRFSELENSSDPRAKLLVKCLRAGFKWAGSSLIHFLVYGTTSLLDFLSEEKDSENGLAHDIDLYRDTEQTKELGKRFVGSDWAYTHTMHRAVKKIKLKSNNDPTMCVEIDEVSIYAKESGLSPSTDIWGNLCVLHVQGCMKAGQLVNSFIPLSVTIHNVLQMDKDSQQPNCYVLRQKAMPTYDTKGEFEPADHYCDGRFRRKLHIRSREKKLVRLQRAWVPGPLVPPSSTFHVTLKPDADGNEKDDDGDGEDEDSEDEEGEDDDDESDDNGDDDEGDDDDSDNDVTKVPDETADRAIARELQRQLDKLPVWDVYEKSTPRKKQASRRTEGRQGQVLRRSKRRKRV